MLSKFVDHVVVYFEILWEKYPILRPLIEHLGIVWRHSVRFLKVLSHNKTLASYPGRQPFLVCYTNSNPLYHFLQNGYEYNNISLKDQCEVWSVRKLVENKSRQIHYRLYTPPENFDLSKKYIFELRGHAEFSYDYHPVKHWRSEEMKSATEEGLSILRANNVECIEADRANEQLELEKHLEWIMERMERARRERRPSPRRRKAAKGHAPK